MQWDVTKTFFIVFIVCVSSKSVNSMKTGVWWRGGRGLILFFAAPLAPVTVLST